MNFIWHNGAFKDADEAVFNVADRIRLGDGVFDTMLVVVEENDTPNTNASSTSGAPRTPRLILPDLHFTRISHNANLVGMGSCLGIAGNGGVFTEEMPSIEGLMGAAQALMAQNKPEAGRYALNTIISRGPGERGLRIPDEQKPQIIMRLSPVPDNFPAIHAVIAKTVRRNEGSPLSRIKSCSYADNILALREAEERGGNEAIMLNNAGHVTCAAGSNIFAVIDGVLTTPPLSDGVLDGVTRHILMQRYEVREQSLSEDDLRRAEGIYLTNSIRGAVPVVTLDGGEIPTPSLHIPQYFHLE